MHCKLEDLNDGERRPQLLKPPVDRDEFLLESVARTPFLAEEREAVRDHIHDGQYREDGAIESEKKRVVQVVLLSDLISHQLLRARVALAIRRVLKHGKAHVFDGKAAAQRRRVHRDNKEYINQSQE